MNSNRSQGWGLIWILICMIVLAACSQAPDPNLPPAATPTPTPPGGDGPLLEPTPEVPSRCQGLSGELEMLVLVGPAEAAGLEPFAVGVLPFTVQSNAGVHSIQGGGPISYQEVLTREWGTYTVRLDMDTTIDGECMGDEGREKLEFVMDMSGEQMLEVRAEGFSGDYPWSGSHQANLSFPLEEGATAEGEGWAFVLHLNQ
jgi:hypothetical protein